MDVAQTVKDEIEKEEASSSVVAEAVASESQETPIEQSAETSSGDQSSAALESTEVESDGSDWHLELGPEYAGLSEEQAIARLEEERASVARIPQIEQQNRELQAYLQRQQQQFSQWAAQQQQQAQFSAQQQEQARQREATQKAIPTALSQHEILGLERNEKGALVAKEGYPSDLPSRFEARQQFEREQLNLLISQPEKFFSDHMASSVQEAVEARVQQQAARLQQQFTIEQFDRENGDWIWQDRGSQTLSKYGQIFVANAQAFAPLGLDAAFSKGKEMAQMQALVDHAQQQPQVVAPQTPSQTKAERDMALMRAAAKKTSGAPRRGDARTSLPTLGANGKFPNIRDMLVKDFETAGINGSADW